MEEPAYFKYFDQHCPLALNAKPKHEYTVQITRAMFSEEALEVYIKYQKHVHKDTKDLNKEQYERFLCQCPLFDKEEPFAAMPVDSDFKNDQIRTKKDEGVWPQYHGCYHMEHRIDGRLFAVGVMDLTAHSLSSVYLYYDPDFEFIAPGTLCALREIEYMKRVRKDFDDGFKMYILGYYFQDC